jgi:hypothetical protein
MVSCNVQKKVNLEMSFQAILIRIGVDQTFGQWNAPCNPETKDFVYVPIPQDRPNIQGMEKYYNNYITPALHDFSIRNDQNILLPINLQESRMHLDPDFDHLSYGDSVKRGRRLLSFKEDDMVVFYASLRSIHGESELIYALVGLLVVKSLERVEDILPDNYDSNAHTRNIQNNDSDIIVRGKSGISGRFAKYSPIGEFRNRSYRVKRDLLDTWGNLSVKDGWIQRSVNPPLFLAPEKFMRWIEIESPSFKASNN